MWRARLVFIVWLAFSFAGRAGEPSSYTLRWRPDRAQPSFDVVGVSGATLQELQSENWQAEDWQKLFSVYVNPAAPTTAVAVPAMLGSYRVEQGLICFQPKFPLERGVSYRAVFRPVHLPGAAGADGDVVSSFSIPPIAYKPATVVKQIYPSADVLPENLLKFYVYFSAPMQGGRIYDHIHLRNEAGQPVELPFLEIDEELWNPGMTRLTLFIDPGRIKRGVRPLEDVGPALEAGKRYTLEIDSSWRDSTGTPLRESHRKSFRVVAADREPPDPATWKIKAPKATTRDELTVIFPEPMDQALSVRVIGVSTASGRRLDGTVTLAEHEQHWIYTPLEVWKAGRHQLLVRTTIEDLAGNNIGKPFDVDLSQGTERRFTNEWIKLPFEVR